MFSTDWLKRKLKEEVRKSDDEIKELVNWKR